MVRPYAYASSGLLFLRSSGGRFSSMRRRTSSNWPLSAFNSSDINIHGGGRSDSNGRDVLAHVHPVISREHQTTMRRPRLIQGLFPLRHARESQFGIDLSSIHRKVRLLVELLQSERENGDHSGGSEFIVCWSEVACI